MQLGLQEQLPLQLYILLIGMSYSTEFVFGLL